LTALLRAEKIFLSTPHFFYGIFLRKIGVTYLIFHHQPGDLFGLAGGIAFWAEFLVNPDEFVNDIGKQGI